MKTEKFNEKMFKDCVDKYKLIPNPNIPDNNMPDKHCSICNTPYISMILDNPRPVKGPGTMPMCHLYGCPKCKTISYEKSVFEAFAGGKCPLKDYLIKTGRIENTGPAV